MEIGAAQARAGDVDGALKTAAQVGDRDQRALLLAAVAAAQAKAGDVDVAKQTVGQITDPGIKVNALAHQLARRHGDD